MEININITNNNDFETYKSLKVAEEHLRREMVALDVINNPKTPAAIANRQNRKRVEDALWDCAFGARDCSAEQFKQIDAAIAALEK